MDAMDRFFTSVAVVLVVFILSLSGYSMYRNDLKEDECKGVYVHTYSNGYVCIDAKVLK